MAVSTASLAHRKNSKKCDPCDYDGSLEEACAFCIDCVEYLCSKCLSHHRKIKATREHKVLTQESIPDSKDAFEKMQSIVKCSIHEDFDVKYKCEDHNKYACLMCERTEHISCNKLSLFDISKGKVVLCKEEIRERISNLQVDKYGTFLTELEDSILFLLNEKTRIIEHRVKLVQELENALEQLKKKTSEFQSGAQRTINDLKKKKGEIEKVCKSQKDEELFLETVLNYGSPSQQFIASKEILKQRRDDFHLDEPRCYRFDNTMDHQIKGLIESLSTMNWEIIVREDVRTVPDRLPSRSSDLFVEDLSLSRDLKVDDKPGNNKQFRCIETKQKTSKQRNKSDKDSPNVALSNILSVVMKEARAENEEESEWGCKTFTEVLLHGAEYNTDRLGLAVTKNEVFVVTLRDTNVVLLLDEKLQVFETLRLEAGPSGVCSIEAKRIAILCSDRTVRKYEIVKKHARKYNDFKVNAFCNNIAKYGDAGIVLLYITLLHRSSKNNKAFKVYLEIRDHFSGRVSKEIQIDLVPQNIENVLLYSPQIDRIAISDGNVLRLYSESGEDCAVFSSPGTRAMTGNRGGKIYIHSHVNHSIVATSENYKSARVYQTVSKFRTTAITYGEKSRRIVIVGLKD